MPSDLQVDTIKDASASNTLVEQSGSDWVWGSGVPAGSVAHAGIIDIPAVSINCYEASEAVIGGTITHDGGGQVLGDTTITPKLTTSKFLFSVNVHVDKNVGTSFAEKLALWHTQSGTNTLVIETFWYRRVANTESLPHVGTGFINNTNGDAFTVKIRGYTQDNNNFLIGMMNGTNGTNSNKTSSFLYWEVAT